MRRMAIWMIAVAATVSACGGGDTTGVEAQLGTYQLVSVDGANVPALLNQGESVTVALVSGSLTLKSGGVMVREQTVTTTIFGESDIRSRTDQGTFTLNGSELSVTLDDGTQEAGSLKGFELLLSSDGRELSYARR
jgi:hypothetical protein